MAGSICPEPLITKVFNNLNMHGVCIVYGLTETSPVATLMGTQAPFDKKTQTVGHAAPMVEIKMVDEHGETVPVGDAGEVCIRGYLTMQGYWDDDEKTKQTKCEDGWLRSGDLGILDEDGYVSIIGRTKDMIIRGGENISPKEVEEFFGKHHSVRDVQVISCEDEYFGEDVVAYMVPAVDLKTALDKQNFVDELVEYTSGKLSHFKVPKYIKLVDSYPLTATGKVRKNVMREETNDILK